MGKRRVTDYNTAPPSRFVKWWVAPDSVSGRARKVSAFFIGTLVVGLTTMFVISSMSSTPENTSAAAVPDTTVSSSVLPAPVVRCPAQDPVPVTPEQLVSTRFSTKWVREGDMSRPTSDTGGPGQQTPFNECFSRTPEGVLYATASFASGILLATAAGDQKDFFAARASHTGNYSVLMNDLAAGVPVQNRPQTTITGYRWNSYTPDLASIELRYSLITGPRAGTNAAVTYTMTWENNDWLLVIPGKSDIVSGRPDADRIYIPWGGNT